MHSGCPMSPKIKKWLARQKVRISTGQGQIGIFNGALIGVVLLKQFNISNSWIPPALASMILIDWLIGYIWIKYGAQREENEYATKELNPVFSEMQINLKGIARLKK